MSRKIINILKTIRTYSVSRNAILNSRNNVLTFILKRNKIVECQQNFSSTLNILNADKTIMRSAVNDRTETIVLFEIACSWTRKFNKITWIRFEDAHKVYASIYEVG